MTVGDRSKQFFNRYATVQRLPRGKYRREFDADFHGKLFNLPSNSLGVMTATP
jgi:hypothetical protein